MHREHEYKHLADNARKRGGEEQNAQFRANGKFWLPLTCSLPISRRRSMTPAHITIRWILREPCGPSLNLRPHLRGLNLLRVDA
jgi:hypothetical protein